MLTEFIKDIFGYDYLGDYNYMFRMIDGDKQVIIDIYDNVSENRFNRYIYDFMDDSYSVLLSNEDDVYIKKVSVVNADKNGDNVVKLGYLFKLDNNLMIDYAYEFLDMKYVEILKCIIENKPI